MDIPNELLDNPAVWGVYHRRLRQQSYVFEDYNNPFRHRPFLILPLLIKPRNKGYKKSRQAGVSENAVTETLWALDQHPINVVYTFPSPKQVEDFSNTRFKPALIDSKRDYLKSIMGDPQNVTLRKIGKGYLFLRSSSNPNLGEGIDADMVVFDEIDRMRANVGIAFKESLSSSKFGWVREVSTPTLPNKGIDIFWQKSNQMLWQVKCEACGKWQPLEYPKNIKQLKEDPPYSKLVEPGTYAFCCSKCKSEKIDRWNGRWVPTYSGRPDHVCFQINQLMCVWITADQIMQKKKDYRFLQLFYNYVLGETYAADNILLDQRHLEGCMDPELRYEVARTPRYSKIVVGIDWGNLNWCVVYGISESGVPSLLNLKMAEDNSEPLGSAKEIEKFIAPFKPDIIVADWGYGKDRVTYLSKQFPGRVYGCTYLRDARSLAPRFSETTNTVNVDRTGWLKGLASQFRDKKVRVPVPDQLPLLDIYAKQMTTSVLMHEEDDDGEIKERVDNIGDDHFYHATGYAFMGMEFGSGGSFSFDFL